MDEWIKTCKLKQPNGLDFKDAHYLNDYVILMDSIKAKLVCEAT